MVNNITVFVVKSIANCDIHEVEVGFLLQDTSELMIQAFSLQVTSACVASAWKTA